MTVQTTVTVRDLDWRDLTQVLPLETRLFGPSAWDESSFWAELAQRPRRDYVGLSVDGHLVGYAGLDHIGEASDIMTIAVDPAYQGAGLGHLLLTELIDRAARRGASALLLEVRDDNTAARRLYERAGFSEISRRRRYYQPGDIDAVILRKLIGEPA